MCRKLCILVSFVLVLALGGSAQAWKSIDNPNYNLSFEYDSNGDQIYCSIRVSCKSGWDPNYVSHCGVMAWKENNVDWPIVELPCTLSPGGEGCECKDATWFSSDGLCNLTMGQWDITDQNLIVWQSLDPNYDDNVIIKPYHEYRVSYDTFKWGAPSLKAYLFYGYIPDNNSLDPNVNTIVEDEPVGVPQESNWKTYSIGFLSQSGQPYIGEPLGIRFFQTGEGWYWIDNIRVEYKNLAAAHDPYPEDDATDVPKDANLTWSPGLWVQDTNGHEVYFGSTWAEVNSATTASAEFKGNKDANEYDPGTMVLGNTYYWRIDEVNENYTPGPNDPPVPPDNRWKGEVWSFTVYGRARNPYPEDGASDVPMNVILRWTAGDEAKWHDVYFGTSEADVNSATTASSEYKIRLDLGTEQHDAEALVTVGEQYFWRIDEVNTLTVKGHIWDFTVANYVLVDDFDFYANPTELRAVWKDYYSGVGGGDGVVWVNKDANYAVDGNSMLFEYWNDKSPAYSETRRDYSPAKDWSYSGNGVTALEIDFFGDMNNGPDPPMYVKLSDGTTTAQVNHTDFNDFLEENVHTWNVPLKDFSGVTLSNITSITLGIGDKVTESGGLKEQGTVYFDDIRLQPPRCLPEYDSAADFTGDCVVDNYDLDVMATDWLLADGETLTETRDATLTDFADETSHWVTGRIDSGAIAVNEPGKITVTDPRLFGLTSMSITAWVKQTTVNEWVGIVCSRESPCGGTGEATELGIYGSEWGGPGGLGYDWSCLEDAWRHDSEFVTNVPTDGTWTFIAMSVDPTGCTLYIKADGGELQTGTRNEVEHPAQQNFAESFIIGRSSEDGGYFNGVIDDVRIYGYNLSFADINNLAYETATEPNPPPVYWYKFEEASGYTAADSGTPILVYGPVQSKANLTDPEPKLQRFVNFRDYAIFANDWLDEFKWPEP